MQQAFTQLVEGVNSIDVNTSAEETEGGFESTEDKQKTVDNLNELHKSLESSIDALNEQKMNTIEQSIQAELAQLKESFSDKTALVEKIDAYNREVAATIAATKRAIDNLKDEVQPNQQNQKDLARYDKMFNFFKGNWKESVATTALGVLSVFTFSDEGQKRYDKRATKIKVRAGMETPTSDEESEGTGDLEELSVAQLIEKFDKNENFKDEYDYERLPLVPKATLVVMAGLVEKFDEITFTSVLRTQEENENLKKELGEYNKETNPGGVHPNSAHLYGAAFDIRVKGLSKLEKEKIKSFISDEYGDVCKAPYEHGDNEHEHIHVGMSNKDIRRDKQVTNDIIRKEIGDKGLASDQDLAA